MDCINLANQFGKTFRIFFDEAYNPRHRPKNKLDPWMMTLRGAGKGVELYPAGGSKLSVDIDGRKPTVERLMKIDGVRLTRDGVGSKYSADHEVQWRTPVR